MSPSRARPLATSLLLVLATTCNHPARRSSAPGPAAADSVRAIPIRRPAPPTVHAPVGFPIDTLAVRRPDYRNLLHALARYRQLAADSTLATIPIPDHLPARPGDTLDIVPPLRDRLIALGDLSHDSAAAITDSLYAEPLVSAVRRFQQRHGLANDGVIGRETLIALRTPIASRVAQMEAALAALRQEPPVDSGPFIIVNVPAFRLFAYEGLPDDTAPALESRVIVGMAVKRETPSLANQLRFLDFWPYWDVPRSITLQELIPNARRDSLYLRNENIEMVTRAGVPVGDTITAGALDSLRSGALRVRQRPGPTNSLGRVKFVIPNDSNIYLHDTPDRSLFDKPRRDFSHGCIRVEQARDLAIWASRGRDGWNADSVDLALAGPAFRRVALPRPIPVIIEYITVMASHDGTVWFLPDIYRRNGDSVNTW
jgi:L,D-transpeptidase YcbB